MEKHYTFEEISQLFTQISITQAETSKSIKENDRILTEKFKENERFLTEMFKETGKQFKETDGKFKETDKMFKKTDKDFQELKHIIKDLNKQIGGIGNSNGAFAEEFFYHGFDATMQVNGIKYDYIVRNQNKKIKDIKGEYDIVLTNKNKILVVEVKYKLNRDQVIAFYEKKLPKFKTLFSEFKEFTIYGAVASLSFAKNSQKTAEECGLLVFTQSGDNIKKISPNNLTLSVF